MKKRIRLWRLSAARLVSKTFEIVTFVPSDAQGLRDVLIPLIWLPIMKLPQNPTRGTRDTLVHGTDASSNP